MSFVKCRPICLALLGFSFLGSGCTSVNKIAEYEFEGKSMAVIAPYSPPPEIYTESPTAPATEEKKEQGGFLNTLSRIAEVATDVAQAFTEVDAQAKLDSAAAIVDVSMLVAEGMQDAAARYLSVQKIDDVNQADLLLEVNIKRHGIYSGAGYDQGLSYVLEAEPELLDNMTGEVIWRRNVKETFPFTSTDASTSRTLSSLDNAVTLSQLTVDQLAAMLESMAADSAREIVRKLSEDIRDARN